MKWQKVQNNAPCQGCYSSSMFMAFKFTTKHVNNVKNITS